MEQNKDFLRESLKGNPLVKDIRGRGVRNSIEYCTNDDQLFSQQISEKMFNEKNIIVSSKWHRTSFSHAMTLEKKEIDYFLDSFCSIFKELTNTYYSSNKSKTKEKQYF